MENSKIEWTDHTFNPWMGCSNVSPGCDHCYAELTAAIRYGKVQWGPKAERVRTKDWRKPFKWNRESGKFDHQPRVFCASWADVWDNQAPQEWREELFGIIDGTQNLDWLLLTKRPQNITKFMPPGGPRQNVWLGTTVENETEAKRRIPVLTAIPAVVRFLSVEPMLEGFVPDLAGIDWVICGGESGPKKRFFNPDWARALRDHCKTAGVPFFMKQMDGRQPIPPDLMVRDFPVPRRMGGMEEPQTPELAPAPISSVVVPVAAIHADDALIRPAF